MPRPCGPCSDKRRNELDRRLLEMEISGETFRGISREYGYSEDALSRHKANHLILDLSEVKQARDEARAEALEKVKAEELEQTKAEVKSSISGRLELAGDFFDQLKILRERAAMALEKAEGAEDLKTILLAVKELREMVRLWAEIEGKIKGQQINVTVDIFHSPQWLEVGRALAEILEPESPELRQKIAARLYLLAEAHK